MAMSPWVTTADPKALRRLGKLCEELGELVSRVSRAIIQGVDGLDPDDGRPNRAHLADEIADVAAQCSLTAEFLGLDAEAIEDRASEKTRQMAEWEAHFADGE